ncbi:9410_t:CDS:1 [Funneliformis geosporum]|uniref:6518_t:CDS:1 n=1 Tax=Funneliformis geosporum TaxID=1117311 RepID=A0A9W4SFY7_9GLOM|nr:9410_t:CDS:1 [Funneliformis geosporum]CAI2167135.1 6518_t:CDS:1 [Funneliformis geosporum]
MPSQPSQLSTSVVLYYSTIPSLIFSICFVTLFAATSLLHLNKLIKLKRTIYVYLLLFSLLRTCLFAFRAAWSQKLDSVILGVTSNVLLSGGFFVIIEALYILLTDWLFILIGGTSEASLSTCEGYLIKVLKIFSPSFSIIGIMGEILEFDTHIALVPLLRQISSLGFLCLVIIYIILVTHFAIKYGDGAIRKQLKALVLFISAALLLIELIYRTFISFANESNPVNDYEWAFYVFECIPEIILLITLGGVILGEWFYCVEDDNELMIAQQLAKLQEKGKFNSCLFKNNVRREESTQEKKDVGKTNSIVIDMNNSTHEQV